jgi:sugar lactone lactonase YvrE
MSAFKEVKRIIQTTSQPDRRIKFDKQADVIDLYKEDKMRRRIFITTVIVILCAIAAMSLPVMANGPVEVLRAFDESPNYLPEGIAIDKQGNIFVGLGPPFFVGGGYGALRQIAPDGTETVLVEYPEGPSIAGLTVDAPGNVYFALTDPGQPETGVYRVKDTGAERLPGTENMLVPNGLAFDTQGNLYATDSLLGSIWRISRDETVAAESWLSHDLITGCGEEDPFGANGIALWHGGFYVANTAKGILVYVPIQPDGTPGNPELVAGNPECSPNDDLYGMDGIALDAQGNVYALLVLQHKLVRIDPKNGTFTILLTEEDGLWNPASLAFGTGQGERETLFITNYAVLPPEPANSLGPAVLKFEVGVPGLPLP